MLKDLETVDKRLEKARTAAKGNDAAEKKVAHVLERLRAILDKGEPALALTFENDDEPKIVRDLALLTSKPMFYVAT